MEPTVCVCVIEEVWVAGSLEPCLTSPPPPAAAAPQLWRCQAAAAATQAAFVVGSVYLKGALQLVDEDKGETFHPIVYAFIREAVAGPILYALAWLAGGERGQGWEGSLPSPYGLPLLSSASPLETLASSQPSEPPPPPPLLPAGPRVPQRQDVLRIAALGACMFLSQLFYIIGIEESGVTVATCMQARRLLPRPSLAWPCRLRGRGWEERTGQGASLIAI